ncbi:MAG: hydrogenase expression protein HypE [Acidibrevibacterium sp.]|uniref:hydrogenase large subunit n=1 Tax=Acidibrevibacterium sp. TaxID=2606776 RepID=UPI003D02B76A
MTPWDELVSRLSAGATLLGLWGEPKRVHIAWLDGNAIRHLARDCPDHRYPSLGARFPPAVRLERGARDVYGLDPVGLPDRRPWLDHGTALQTYPFLPVEGDALHQIPVGPVHAGIIEPGHFRFTCDGETVVRLEARLGYVHRGVERLMKNIPLASAAKLVGRISGDSTVAYALAFAQAAEVALGVSPPPRAVWLRAIMAELERLANHFGDIGAICNDGGFSLMLAHCAILRERVLRAAETCFGHRLMMDRVVPGGVAVDLAPQGVRALQELGIESRARFPALVTLYDLTASLQDRTNGTGILPADLAQQFGAGGVIGRASGRDFDARRIPGYAPYDALTFTVPVLHQGDVNARIWIRIKEVEQSLGLIAQLLAGLPPGTTMADFPPGSGEGMALVEGFRGDIFLWLAIAEGRVQHCHARDPSWLQWPLLETAIEGNIIADFPLCNKSFNCSYAGHDL